MENEQKPTVTPEESNQNTAVTPPAPEETSPAEVPATSIVSEKKSKKMPLIIAAILIFVLGLGAYVFGYYLPNQPENVWSSSLANTGTGLDMLVENISKEENLDKLSKSDLQISLTGSSAGYDIEGTFNSQFDQYNSVNNIKIKSAESAETTYEVDVDILSAHGADTVSPGFFIRLNGIDTLLAGISPDLTSSYGPLLDKYADKWIHVGPDYIESLYGELSLAGAAADNETLTSAEVAELLATIGDVNNEYLFTDDTSKAVITNDGFIDEQLVEETDTMHYNASFNEQNALAYCKAMGDRVLALPAASKLYGDETKLAEAKKNVETSCADSTKDLNKDTHLEVWMNKDQKLLHKVRSSKKADKTNYVEFGQKYDGNETLTLFSNYIDESEQLTVNSQMTVNINTITSTGKITAESKNDNGYKVEANVELKPLEGSVEYVKPAEFIDIEDLISDIFGY